MCKYYITFLEIHTTATRNVTLMTAFKHLGARFFIMKIEFVSTSTNETMRRDKEKTTKRKRFSLMPQPSKMTKKHYTQKI